MIKKFFNKDDKKITCVFLFSIHSTMDSELVLGTMKQLGYLMRILGKIILDFTQSDVWKQLEQSQHPAEIEELSTEESVSSGVDEELVKQFHQMYKTNHP